MDKAYWANYYKDRRDAGEPSLFAQFVAENYAIAEGISLIELGCGNGRDSVYFSGQGISTTAVDQVDSEVAYLQEAYGEEGRLTFRCADFTALEDGDRYDIVYSRFTLHSIKREEQDRVVRYAYDHLSDGGLLCIEVRGTGNEIYRLGEAVPGEEDAYVYEEHYRRFLNFDALRAQLRGVGFALEFEREAAGFAPYGDTDYTFIRVIGRKQG